MSDRDKFLAMVLRHCWNVFNTIRARDGVAYQHDNGMPYYDEQWWDELTELCDASVALITGEDVRPWPFVWELSEADSAAFIDALLNPPEPNDALRAAAGRYKATRAAAKP